MMTVAAQSGLVGGDGKIFQRRRGCGHQGRRLREGGHPDNRARARPLPIRRGFLCRLDTVSEAGIGALDRVGLQVVGLH
jgi:hypothetical protein